jgi:hypothetical protein
VTSLVLSKIPNGFFKNPDIYAARLNSIFKENEAVYNEELELVDGRF